MAKIIEQSQEIELLPATYCDLEFGPDNQLKLSFDGGGNGPIHVTVRVSPREQARALLALARLGILRSADVGQPAVDAQAAIAASTEPEYLEL